MPLNEHLKVLFDASNLRVGGGVQVAASLVDELIALSEDRDIRTIFPWLGHIVFWLSPEVARNLQTEGRSQHVVLISRSLPRDICRRFRHSTEKYFGVHFTVFGPRYGPSLGVRTVTGIADVTSVYRWPAGVPAGSFGERVKRKLRGVIARELFAMEDLLVSESHSLLKEFVGRKRYPIDQTVVIPNAPNRAVADPSFRRNMGLDLREQLSEGEVLLGYVARLYPHKNHAFLPVLAEELKTRGVRVRFAVTLSESEWESASDDLRRFSINAGVLPIEQVASFFENCDAAIFPSLLESFSATPLEALLCEKTLFASDRPFVREVCGDLPIYIDPLDASTSASVIARELQTKPARLRESQAVAGHERMRFSARDRALSLVSVLAEAVEPDPKHQRSKNTTTQNEPLKCLVVTEHLSHYREGVYRELQHIGGLDVSFLGGPDTQGGEIPEVDTALLRDFRRASNIRILHRFLWQPEAVASALSGDFDIYIFVGNFAFISTWVAAMVARLRGKRVYFWTHGWKKRDAGVKRIARNAFYSLSNGLLLYGNHGKTIALENGFDPERLHVIYNSLELPITDRVVREDYDRSRTQVWAISSRLLPQRHFDQVIRMAAEFRRKGRDVKLQVIGDGPERSTLEALAHTLDTDVRFHGAVYDPALTYAILGKSDILLAPREVGLAAVHAMAAGCPVATHGDMDRQNPEAELVVDGLTGVLAPYGDLETLCEKAWAFVGAEDREQTARQCREAVIPDWTPKGQAEAIATVLLEQGSSRACHSKR